MTKYGVTKRFLALFLTAVLTLQGVGEFMIPEVLAAQMEETSEMPGKVQETVNPEEPQKSEETEKPEETEGTEETEEPEETEESEKTEETEIPEEAPATPEEAPATPEEAPATPEETPAVPEETPEESKETPELPEEGLEKQKTVQTAADEENDETAEPEETDRESKEYFYDTDEIGLQIVDGTFRAFDQNNGSLTVKESERHYDLTENPFYDIKKLSFELKFTIKKDDGTRQIKKGDTLTVAIPRVLAIAQDTTNKEIKKGELTIATYEITQNNELVLTFTENVDQEEGYFEIAGGLKLELNVDSETLKDQDKNLVLIQKRGDEEPEITVEFPELSNEISGISKWGMVNTADNTIQWTIRVGTDADCKGADLSGVKLEEIFGEQQSFVAAYVGEGVAGEQIIPDADGNLPLKDLGLTAPATITVVTAVKKEVLEEAMQTENGVLQVENTVKLQAADQSTTIDEEHASASATVWVNTKSGVTKYGVQLDSHTIQWTVNVNENPQVTLYEGVVTDALAEGLRYKEGSFQYQFSGGEKTACSDPVERAPAETDLWKDHQLFIQTDRDGKQTLYFRLAQETGKKYTLTFQTEVEDGTLLDNDQVTNTVSIDSKLPYWSENGTTYLPMKNQTPGVGVKFYQAKLNKSVTVDQTKVSGQLTWTLQPSTRIEADDYDTAVITDTIESDQEYCVDSLKIYYKGEVELSVENGETVAAPEFQKIFTWNYDEESAKLTLTFHRDQIVGTSSYSADLRDYRIEYQTTALNYLHTNQKWHRYSNTATLEIKKNGETCASNSSTASADLTSNWISKSTRFEYDKDGKPYFHYTIYVNANYVKDLTNVSIKDDISQAIRFQTDDTVSEDWTIDKAKTKVSVKGGTIRVSEDQKCFECTFTNLSEAVQIDLYVTYTGKKSELTKGIYQNQVLYSHNEAGVKSEEIFDETTEDQYFIAISEDKWSQVFDNTLVTKGEGCVHSDQGTKIKWQIRLNPNSGEMGTVTITDTIEKSQKYIQDSVKLYEAVFTEGQSYISVGKEIEPDHVRFDVSETDRTMEITVDVKDRALFLEYETGIVDSIAVAENGIFVTESGWEYGSAKAKAWLSGSNWGTLKSVGNVRLQKYDATAGLSFPLAGAEITIYADAEGKDKVDIGVTDENGVVEFKGLEVGLQSKTQTYYYQETKAPQGYTVDPTVREVEVRRGNTVTVDVANVRDTIETETVKLTKAFYYTDQDGNRAQADGQTAQFELIFYPHGKNDLTDAKKLTLSGEDGHYQYEAAASRKGTVLTNDPQDGTLTIEKLPWGYYGIREIKTAEGFIADKTEHFFEISKDLEIVYSQGESGITLLNESTRIYVVKRDEETEEVIEDILFTITDENGDVVEDPLNDDQPYEWKSTDEPEQVDNLPEGTYELWEGNKEEPDLEFTIEEDGTLTIDGETIEDSTIEIIDDSVPVEVTKYRDWVEAEERPAIDESEYELFAGVKFTLKGKLLSGEDEREYVTDEEGVFTLRYLLIDGETYTLIEETPVGYEEFEIDTTFIYYAETGVELIEYEEGLVSGEGDAIDILNISKQGAALQLILYNAKTKKGVPGVEFELEGSNTGTTELVSGKEGETTTYETPGKEKEHELSEGEVFAPNLPAGDYTLEQTTVPEGYDDTEEKLKISFTISENERNSIITIDEEAIRSGKYGIEVISGNLDALFQMEPLAEAQETKEQQEQTAVSEQRAVQLQQNEAVAQTLGHQVLPKTSREDLRLCWAGGGALILLGAAFCIEEKKKRHC